jgi:2-iminobutanoate/2-iminopropanoate deaminase
MAPQVILSDRVSKPSPSYSQAMKLGNLLFTSGQVSIDAKTNKIVGLTIEEQTKQTLENLKAVVEAAGFSLSDVLKTTVFLKRASDFQGMVKIYETYFKAEPPARTTIEGAMMHPDLLVEIEAIACK